MKTKYLKPEIELINNEQEVLLVSCDNFIDYDKMWDTEF